MNQILSAIICCLALTLGASGQSHSGNSGSASSNKEMAELLASISKKIYSPNNIFSAGARLEQYNKSISLATKLEDSIGWQFSISRALLELGDEKSAIALGEQMIRRVEDFGPGPMTIVVRNLALAYLRDGERTNCVMDHTNASCIFPIAGRGIQSYKTGSQKAIELYEALLTANPSDAESRWLLNIAYMAIGQYPQSVPADFLIAGLDKQKSTTIVKPFEDLSMQAGVSINNLAGGSIIDDFDNDGYLDMITSNIDLEEGMNYFKNDKEGGFENVSGPSGLSELTGGLNIMQTDYNNDGWKDVFVLRGAWFGNYGEQPNSLLRNNGDGTFTDVTKESGLLSFHPTQAATWADFNNDGWLDLFIGNETMADVNSHTSELYVNNKNGTFTEMAKAAGCDFTLYVKGVTSGDFDNDDRMDLFISTIEGKKILLKNTTDKSGPITFANVSKKAGLTENKTPTFTTWFWDYDNDGWLDIMVAGYNFTKSLAFYAGQEAMNIPMEKSGEIFLYRNKHDGTFEDVSDKAGFDKIVFSMGANFGDIDNDGYLDAYFGTGNPLYQSLVPNKLYYNLQGKAFADVTTSARVGNLQKGHAVSFADLDYDGDQDIHIEMGGAYLGDGYQNSLFINPGQSDNHWIKIVLEGVEANKAAIGAKIKVIFEENGRKRFVYRELNSGGSFGSNPLMQQIGTGQATVIRCIEIKWPGSKTFQQFVNVRADQNIMIKEGSSSFTTFNPKKVDFSVGKGTAGSAHHGHH